VLAVAGAALVLTIAGFAGYTLLLRDCKSAILDGTAKKSYNGTYVWKHDRGYIPPPQQMLLGLTSSCHAGKKACIIEHILGSFGADYSCAHQKWDGPVLPAFLYDLSNLEPRYGRAVHEQVHGRGRVQGEVTGDEAVAQHEGRAQPPAAAELGGLGAADDLDHVL
jgi:hypothetical protein